MKIFVFAVAAAACAQPVLACDFCSVYLATEIRAGTGFYAGVAEQFTHFGTAQEDGKEVPNDTGQFLDSSITQVLLGYNFNQRFGLQANVPLVYRSFERPEGFETDRGTESGVGDVSMIARYLVARHQSENQTLFWNVFAGVKFPTGDTARLREELNEVEIPGAPESGIHGHDLTLGSGSCDGIVGTTVYARRRRAFFGANVQYTIRSQGDFNYQFANDLTWSAGPGVLLLLREEFTLSLQANISGETKDRDTFEGDPAEDTGLTIVYAGPEFTATWKDKLSAEVGVDVPVSRDNTAFQIVSDYRVHAAVTWHF